MYVERLDLGSGGVRLNVFNPPAQSVATIGTFDGLHRGHQVLIQETIQRAKQLGIASILITFDPHPRAVLKGAKDWAYITPLQEKIDVLKTMGIDRLYIIHFTPEVARLTPRDFIETFLVPLHIRHYVVGFDFRFGHKASGRPEDLVTDASVGLTVVPPVALTGTLAKVASSMIRDALQNGDVEQARDLLGRPYRLRGLVVRGAGRGHALGFPTANLLLTEPYVLPKSGVYGVCVERARGSGRGSFDDGQKWLAVMNLGTKPTVEDHAPLSLEVHLLDYSGDLYGQDLQVTFLFRIRDEQKFPSIEALSAQIQKDVQFAKERYLWYTSLGSDKP